MQQTWPLLGLTHWRKRGLTHKPLVNSVVPQWQASQVRNRYWCGDNSHFRENPSEHWESQTPPSTEDITRPQQPGTVCQGPVYRQAQERGQGGGTGTICCERPPQTPTVLGRPAIKALDLAAHVGAVQEDEKFPEAHYSNLFTGLGKLDGEYSIQLEEGAKPFALIVPRRVAIPLMQPVKEELERMEKLGVISRVSEPTEWCAGMVVVGLHLCRYYPLEQERLQRETPSSSCGAVPGTARRCSCIQL